MPVGPGNRSHWPPWKQQPKHPRGSGRRTSSRSRGERASSGSVPSNNPTKDLQHYQEKLERLGPSTPLEDIANTIVTTVRRLTSHHPGSTVFPIAGRPLIAALEAAGVRLSEDPAEIDIVLASYDRTFDDRKLQIAFDALYEWVRLAEVRLATGARWSPKRSRGTMSRRRAP